MARAVTPFPVDTFNLYLARVLENAEMATPEYRARYGIETRHGAHGLVPPRRGDSSRPRGRGGRGGHPRLPVADWRRAFKLGYLLAAAHNLRLLDVVMQVAWRAAGVERRHFIESLASRLATAPQGTALAAIDAVLERYADAVLAAEAMVLPAAQTGDHLWAVEDAVVLAALGAAGRFFDEIDAFVREDLTGGDTALLTEAVRYQRLVTPVPGETAERRAELTHDFPGWLAEASSVERSIVPDRATSLSWTPLPVLAQARDPRGFLTTYLSLVHARTATGILSTERERADRA